MTKLLHISSSPRGEESESLALASTFLEALTDVHPNLSIDNWDLWDGSLPSFGPDGAGAKMRIFAGEQPVGTQEIAWRRARNAFERVADADVLVFSVPMWNAGVPYILKQFIDVVSQPGMVFSFDPESGYEGLLKEKSAVVFYTSAVYGRGRAPSFGADFQAPYLEDWLSWAGIDEVNTLEFRPNLATADSAGARSAAHERARELAHSIANREYLEIS